MKKSTQYKLCYVEKRYVVHFVNSNFFFLNYSVRFDSRIISMFFLFQSIFSRHFFNMYMCVSMYETNEQRRVLKFNQSNFDDFVYFVFPFIDSIYSKCRSTISQSAFDVNYWRMCEKSSAKYKSNFIEKVMIIFCLTYANLSLE